MRRIWSGLLLACLAACSVSDPVSPEVRIEQPWARATPEAAATGAVYAVIRNAGAADRLIAVESSASASAELHRTSHEGHMAQMRAVDVVEVPAQGEVRLEPGALHLMLNGLRAPLVAGQNVPVTFVFEHSGRIEVQAQVLPIDALGAAGHADAHTEHHH